MDWHVIPCRTVLALRSPAERGKPNIETGEPFMFRAAVLRAKRHLESR